MKVLFTVLCIAALGFAANDGCNESSISVNRVPATDAVTLTVVNDFSLSGKSLGIDVFEGSGYTYILGTDNVNMYVQAWDAGTGGALGTLPLDAANTSCFGIAWNNDLTTDAYYTDDWANSNLFYTEDFGVTWTTTANPAGTNARGMDFDGTDYWTTNADGGGLWRFQPGVGQENISIPEVPSQPSGLAVFPYMGDLGVAVTTYNTHNIYFYSWDGSTMSYLGSAACPISVYSSYGLSYSENTGNLFWTYAPTSGTYKLAEISFTITSLSRDTWAGIKTAF